MQKGKVHMGQAVSLEYVELIRESSHEIGSFYGTTGLMLGLLASCRYKD